MAPDQRMYDDLIDLSCRVAAFDRARALINEAARAQHPSAPRAHVQTRRPPPEHSEAGTTLCFRLRIGGLPPPLPSITR